MRTSGGRSWTTLGGAVGIVMALLSTSCGLVSNDASGGRDRRIQVVTVWTGYELELFEQIVEGYERFSSIDVDLVSPGDDLDSFIRARHQAGDPPDVALIPQPALIRDYAEDGLLQPLDEGVREDDDQVLFRDRYAELWQELGEANDGRFYGAWIKLTNKSLLWCLPADQAAAGRNHDCETLPGDNPRRWDKFADLTTVLTDTEGAPAPLALGAADGWTVSDWFENLLAVHDIGAATDAQATGRCIEGGTDQAAGNSSTDVGQQDEQDAERPAGAGYNALANGADGWDRLAVERALCDLAQIWSVPGAFPKPGVRRALLTQFDESVIQVAGTEQATVVLAGDSAATLAAQFAEQDPEFPLAFFPFPSPTDARPMILAGDAAVVFEGSEHGEDFVEWLTNREMWPVNQKDDHPLGPFKDAFTSLGYISPVKGVYAPTRSTEREPDPDPWAELCQDDERDMCTVAWYVGWCTDQTLQGVPGGEDPCVPEEGRAPVPVNHQFDLSDQLSADCRGLLEGTLQDFLVDVGTGGNDRSAVKAVIDTMDEAAQEGRCRRR